MKARLFGLEWDVVEPATLACGEARVLLGERLGWVTPRGAVVRLGSERGCAQFEALLLAETGDDEALVAFLAGRGLDVRAGEKGVVIGVPDPHVPEGPLTFRAAGVDLRSAVRDLAGRF